MSESDSDGTLIEIDKMSVDQFAGAVVLIFGAVGSLLLVIWQSACHCRVNLCYIFQCERRPPSEERMKTLASETQSLRGKKQNSKKDEVDELQSLQTTEPEPEPEMEKLV